MALEGVVYACGNVGNRRCRFKGRPTASCSGSRLWTQDSRARWGWAQGRTRASSSGSRASRAPSHASQTRSQRSGPTSQASDGRCPASCGLWRASRPTSRPSQTISHPSDALCRPSDAVSQASQTMSQALHNSPLRPPPRWRAASASGSGDVLDSLPPPLREVPAERAEGVRVRVGTGRTPPPASGGSPLKGAGRVNA